MSEFGRKYQEEQERIRQEEEGRRRQFEMKEAKRKAEEDRERAERKIEFEKGVIIVRQANGIFIRVLEEVRRELPGKTRIEQRDEMEFEQHYRAGSVFTLQWGNKFEETPEDKRILAEYRKIRIRYGDTFLSGVPNKRLPAHIVLRDYSEVRFGVAEVSMSFMLFHGRHYGSLSTEDFIRNPESAIPLIVNSINDPQKVLDIEYQHTNPSTYRPGENL